MHWAVWVDEHRDVHVVSDVDVPVMAVCETPSPWHRYGPTCPCQPRVIDTDWMTGRHVLGHKDPVQ